MCNIIYVYVYAGVTYKILSCSAKNEGRKRKKKSGSNAAASTESLTTFLWRTGLKL